MFKVLVVYPTKTNIHSYPTEAQAKAASNALYRMFNKNSYSSKNSADWDKFVKNNPDQCKIKYKDFRGKDVSFDISVTPQISVKQ